MRVQSVFETALIAEQAGIAVIPAVEDGQKRPEGKWAQWQNERPSKSQIETWFGNGLRTGMAFVLGEVSGSLECLDIESDEVWHELVQLAAQVGLGDLLRKVTDGYLEQTPRGGRHILYRCSEIAGSTRLARTSSKELLIETRGPGSVVIVAPSHGNVHPTGKPYVLLSGGPEHIVTISPEDRRALFDLARSFDEVPLPEYIPPTQPAGEPGSRPGDYYNQAASWEEVLTPAGWTRVYERGGGRGRS